MRIVTVNPTSNTTPDPAQGGSAVTGASNTGHGSTTASKTGPGIQDKTCIWTGFPSVVGQIQAVNLKFDWSENGSVVGFAGNQFQTQYSLNGGGSWNTVFNHTNITSSTSSNSTVSLSVSQDLTQVQVRDFLEGLGGDPGETGSVTASVSNIRLEVQVADSPLIVMM